MKAFLVSRMVGGVPDFSDLPHTGNVLCAKTLTTPQYGIYIVTGTAAQITAINALAQVVPLCAITHPDFDNWPEMDGVINSTVRTQLNTWLTKYSLPNIPSNWIYRQVFGGLQTLYLADHVALTDVAATAFRTGLNTWLTARELPNIPTDWTYRQILTAIDNRLRGHWAELGDVIDAGVRTKLNTWLTANGYPNIPAEWTYRQTLLTICLRLNGNYTIESTDVLE